MKKLVLKGIIPAVAIASVAFMYSNTQAGDYHSGSGLVCSDCHTMHNSVDGADVNAGGPFDKLLVEATTNDLCLTCHDGGVAVGSAPDVMTTAGANQATYRAAGAFRAAVGTASVSAHNLGVVADAGTAAPGGTWTIGATGITCADCHNPHGTANYRNLVLKPGGVAADINVTDVTQGVLTPTDTQYDVTNITYGYSADQNPSLSNWCAGCHTNFSLSAADAAAATWVGGTGALGGDEAGDSGGSNAWHRHPTSHVTMTEANANGHADSATYAGLSSATPAATASSVPAADNVPFCGTCHKAHGSDIDKSTNAGWPNNLIYDDGSTATIQDGAAMADTCNNCHNK